MLAASRATSVVGVNWEFGDRDLFGMVAQGARLVEDAHAGGLGALEQPGGGDVFEIEGRILAHQHRVERLAHSTV
jgi:hypothetical protein